MKHFDPRWVVVTGFALFATSNFLNIDMTSDHAADQLLLPNIVRSIGQALVLAWIDDLTQYFLTHGVADRATAAHQALVAIGRSVRHQAYVMAFSDTFLLLGAGLIVALVSTLLLRKADQVHSGGAH